MISFPVWCIPLLITAICVAMMGRPTKGSFNGPSFDGMFRLFWFMPALLAWLAWALWALHRAHA